MNMNTDVGAGKSPRFGKLFRQVRDVRATKGLFHISFILPMVGNGAGYVGV